MEVARLVGGEIVSADSRQAYRGLEIGTAAPSTADRFSVPHHGVAFLEPGERYGAGRFARMCRQWVSGIESRGRVPILAGGTGFFVRALTRPVFREPDLEAGRRSALEAWLAGLPMAEVHRWTDRLDPDLKSRLPVIDRQRGGRALELALLSGRSLTWWQRHGSPDAEPLPGPATANRGTNSTPARRGLDGRGRDSGFQRSRAGLAGHDFDRLSRRVAARLGGDLARSGGDGHCSGYVALRSASANLAASPAGRRRDPRGSLRRCHGTRREDRGRLATDHGSTRTASGALNCMNEPAGS